MAEVKWIKITTNMFDDEKIKLIDAMPERDTIFYIWMRLLVQAGKCNAGGYIFLSENVPYTDEMLSTLFNRPLNSVRFALRTLTDFGMIERSENNDLKITNWDKHQNVEGLEKVREQNRLRKQRQREKKKELIEPVKEDDKSHVTSRDCHAIEQEQEEDKEQDIDIDTTSSSMSVLHHLESCGFGLLSPMLIEKIEADIEIYGAEWVKDAATISDEKGKHRYDYVKGILENWQVNGREEKRGSTRQDNETNSGKPWDFSEFEG